MNPAFEVFPALSVQLPLMVVPDVSCPPYVVFGVHDAMPEVESEPFQVTSGFELSQPNPFGAGLGAGVVAGGVESYFSPRSRGVLFPAASLHEPWTTAFALSGPLYAAVEHEADLAALVAKGLVLVEGFRRCAEHAVT